MLQWLDSVAAGFVQRGRNITCFASPTGRIPRRVCYGSGKFTEDSECFSGNLRCNEYGMNLRRHNAHACLKRQAMTPCNDLGLFSFTSWRIASDSC